MQILILLLWYSQIMLAKAVVSGTVIDPVDSHGSLPLTYWVDKLIKAIGEIKRLEVPSKRFRNEGREKDTIPECASNLPSRLIKLIDSLSEVNSGHFMFFPWVAELECLASHSEEIRERVLPAFDDLMERSYCLDDELTEAVGLPSFPRSETFHTVLDTAASKKREIEALPWDEFALQLGERISRALKSAPRMTMTGIIEKANDCTVQLNEITKDSSAGEIQTFINDLLAVSLEDEWNIFHPSGGIFKVLTLDLDVLESLRIQAFRVILSIPVGEQKKVIDFAKSIGLPGFASTHPNWILTQFAQQLESDTSPLSVMLGNDFDSVLWHSSHLTHDNTLETFRSMAMDIIRATSDDDILIFLGNSPSYLYHPVRMGRPRSFLVPFSGGSDPANKQNFFINDEGLEKYDRIFLEPIRKLARESPNPPKLVFVDKTVTGQSVKVFDELLRRTDGYLFPFESEILQIASISFGYWRIPANPAHVRVREMIFTSQAVGWAFTMEWYFRLVPSFPRRLWHLSSDALLRVFESRPGPADFISNILRVVEQRGLEDVPRTKGSPSVNLVRYGELTGCNGYQSHAQVPLSFWTNELARIMNSMEAISLEPPRFKYPMESASINPLESIEHLAFRLTDLIEIPGSAGGFDFVVWASEIVHLAAHDEYIRNELVRPLLGLLARFSMEKSLTDRIGLSQILQRFPRLAISELEQI